MATELRLNVATMVGFSEAAALKGELAAVVGSGLGLGIPRVPTTTPCSRGRYQGGGESPVRVNYCNSFNFK